MPVLRTSPTSPFGRKVKIAVALLGLSDRVTAEDASTSDPNDPLPTQNPLGKIPILILENGDVLYDSRVIVDYLDALAGGGQLIPAGWGRFEVLRQQALADGLMDAALLQTYEARWRPEERRDQKWLDHQRRKVERALRVAEATLSAPPRAFHIGHVALACALGYLDLRFEGRWRQSHPKLVEWLADFEGRVPAFGATRYVA